MTLSAVQMFDFIKIFISLVEILNLVLVQIIHVTQPVQLTFSSVDF